jgi:hypothetical protein
MCCSHCQHENGESACVRAASGKSLDSKCPACGRHSLPGAALCNHREPPSRNDDCCCTPPAGPLTVDAPSMHSSASHREEPGLLRRPGGERTQGGAVFTDVKTSIGLLTDRDLREPRPPPAPSWVVRLENWRPKRPCPVCVPGYLARCLRDKHACRPPSRAQCTGTLAVSANTVNSLHNSGTVALGSPTPSPARQAAIRVCLIWRRCARTATPPMGAHR